MSFAQIKYAGRSVVPVTARKAIDQACDLLPEIPRHSWNSYECPVGALDCGQGWFIVDAEAMEAIIGVVGTNLGNPEVADGLSTLELHDGISSLEILSVGIGPGTQPLHVGLEGGLYALHLQDQRAFARRLLMSSQDYFNMVLSDGDTLIDDSLNGSSEFEWIEIANDAWQGGLRNQGFVSSTLTLTDPTGGETGMRPRDIYAPHTPAGAVIDIVAAANGWVFVYDPFDRTVRFEDYSPDVESAGFDLLSQLGRGGVLNPVANPLKTYLGGGFSHRNFLERSTDEQTELLKSALSTLPIFTWLQYPESVTVLFPNRWLTSSSPASPASSPASSEVPANIKAVNQYTTRTVDVTETIFASSCPLQSSEDEISSEIGSRVNVGARLIHRDSVYALLEADAPYSVTNLLDLECRATYLAHRVVGMVLTPRGRAEYAGFLAARPSRQIRSVRWCLRETGPVTVINAAPWAPGIIGDQIEGRPHGLVVNGVSGTLAHQRADGASLVLGGAGGDAGTTIQQEISSCDLEVFDLVPGPGDICN